MLTTALRPFLRGCGQMLFQPSARTGTGFLLLILSQSTGAFFMCLAGVLGATLCAYAREHPGRAYFEGEGGFNGGLLGLALAAFYESSAALLVTAFTGGVATGLVRLALLRWLPVPPFTAPFVAAAWPAFFVCGELLGLPAAALPVPQTWHGQAPLTNAAQVLFIPEPWVGALVFAAVWLHSRNAVVWIGGASLVAWLTVLLFKLPGDLAGAGLLGYNALILAAALRHRGAGVVLLTGGIVASVWLSYVFFRTGVTPLSAPFVLSAWLVIGVETVLARRSAHSRG